MPSTMLGYAVALVPLYFFVYLPISSMLYGNSQKPTDPSSFNFNLSSIAPDEPLFCRPHSYTTYILSHEPLIIYIEGFLDLDESAHLLKIRYSTLHFKPCVPAIKHVTNSLQRGQVRALNGLYWSRYIHQKRHPFVRSRRNRP